MAKKHKNFYAVRRGRQTGIFRTWEQVIPLVHGFYHPEYKGFGSYSEAQAYLNGSPLPGSRPARKYFAIQRGRQTGVFHCTWPEVQHLVTGYPGAVYKGFSDPDEAQAFCDGDGYDFGQSHVAYPDDGGGTMAGTSGGSTGYGGYGPSGTVSTGRGYSGYVESGNGPSYAATASVSATDHSGYSGTGYSGSDYYASACARSRPRALTASAFGFGSSGPFGVGSGFGHSSSSGAAVGFDRSRLISGLGFGIGGPGYHSVGYNSVDHNSTLYESMRYGR